MQKKPVKTEEVQPVETSRAAGNINMRMELKQTEEEIKNKVPVQGWDLSANTMVEMVTQGRKICKSAGKRWPQDVAVWSN
jgi:hypothetical protein